MGSLILHDPTVTFDIVTGGVPDGSPADVSCHVAEVEITFDQDDVDAATFCDPGGTEPGPARYTADVDWKLQKTPTSTADDLATYVGERVLVSMKAEAADTEALEFECDFGNVNPGVIGAWVPGEVVEASTSHIIGTDAPVWV